jgi:hypothetical protein
VNVEAAFADPVIRKWCTENATKAYVPIAILDKLDMLERKEDDAEAGYNVAADIPLSELYAEPVFASILMVIIRRYLLRHIRQRCVPSESRLQYASRKN